MATPRALALTLVPTLLAAPVLAQAQSATPERSGARVGVGLHVGLAQLRANPSLVLGSELAIAGHFRFGGAFTDRFHLFGELSILAVPATSVTVYQGALDLGAQGFLGRHFYLRGGVGIVENVALRGNTASASIPGPHLLGAVGYEVHQRGTRGVSLELLATANFLGARSSHVLDHTFTAGVGFDFF